MLKGEPANNIAFICSWGKTVMNFDIQGMAVFINFGLCSEEHLPFPQLHNMTILLFCPSALDYSCTIWTNNNIRRYEKRKWSIIIKNRIYTWAPCVWNTFCVVSQFKNVKVSPLRLSGCHMSLKRPLSVTGRKVDENRGGHIASHPGRHLHGPITVLAERSSHRWCSFRCHTLWGHVGVLAWEHVNHSDPVRRSRRCFGTHAGELTLTVLARFLSVEGVMQILAICVCAYRLNGRTVLDVCHRIRDVSSMAALRWGDAEPGLRRTVRFWIQSNALAAQILIWFHVSSLQDGTGAGCDRATWGRVRYTVPG